MKKTLLIILTFPFILLAETNFSFKTDLIKLTKEEKLFLIEKNIDCVVSKNWPPFIFEDNNKLVGISKDFWDLIKNKTLISSSCRDVGTFHELLTLIQNKKADISLSSAVSEETLDFALFSKPYISYPLAIATTMDKQYISNTSLLNNKKIAVGKNYSSYQILKAKYPKIEFVEVENNIEALNLLARGDVYAVVDILPVLSLIISEYGFKNIKISGTTEFNFDVRFMVRNDYEELVSIINKAIDSITKEELNQIKNKWLSVRLESVVDYSKFWEIGFIIFLVLIILFYRQYILNKHNKKLQEANEEIEKKTIELEKKTKQLAKQKELFEKIYNESTDGIFLVDLKQNRIIDCNDSALKILKYTSKEEFIQLRLEDFFPFKQANGISSIFRIYKMIDIAIEKGSNSFEFIFKNKKAQNIWLEVVLTTINLDDSNLMHVVLRDIDKRKEMEEELNILTFNLEGKVKQEVKKNEEKTKQLLQQSRLAQMGEMISMIAHQWRQPLTAISATTNNLLLRMMIKDRPKDEDLEKEISLISDYSQYLSNTIDDFRNFFKSEKEKIDITLETIVNNSISIIKNSLESNSIKLSIDYSCNETVNVFASEVNQVILNLIKNAEDAILESNLEEGEIKVSTFCEEAFCYITIEDNAKGIPEKIIDKIFDPYFSTKTSKDGTGLGLYMSKIIIKDHCGGELIASNSKNGAIFTIKIPKSL